MEFPQYVPTGVRNSAKEILNLCERWVNDAKKKEAELSRAIHDTEQRIESPPAANDPEKRRNNLFLLRQRRAGVEGRLEHWVEGIACLSRLLNGAGMQETYLYLAAAFSKDEVEERERKIEYLFSAAWSARIDYSKYREKLKKATKLKERIAEGAASLAGLIRQFQSTGISGPGAFESIRELLRTTDNHAPPWENFVKWQFFRQYTLGERAIEPDTVRLPQLGGDGLLRSDPAEMARVSVSTGWGVAPDLPAILDSVAQAARDFEPTEYGFVGAALDSRELSKKQTYLRAYLHILVVHGRYSLFTKPDGRRLLPPVTNAIAAMATQATGMADGGFSDADVRAAVSRMFKKRDKKLGSEIPVEFFGSP